MTSRRRTLDPELTILGGRDFVGLVGRLCREQNWDALTALFGAVGASEQEVAFVSLTDLDTASRVLADALAALPPPKNRGKPDKRRQPADDDADDELAAVRIAAAEALSARSSRPPLVDLERRALGRAATLLEQAGDLRRAALAYEDLGDEPRAAHAWGALGDLDRMEAALSREEQRATNRRAAVDAVRRFEALLTGGERRAAVAAAALVTKAGVEEAATVAARAARVTAGLIDGRGVSVRAAGAPWCRIALLPACLGRDRAAEVPLRDPAVSRRHALLRADGDGFTIEDAGSRGGVRIGGARVDAPLSLRGTGEIGLGGGTSLRFTVGAASMTLLLEGSGGLDRSLRALVGVESVPLAPLIPGTDGLSLTWAEGARLVRSPGLSVRVDGHFIGPGCDLMHGDVIEILPAGGSPVRLEVE
ncbi:MAG TPA: FHA domain-containing protein [Polyangia bacterium]|nr:FHA domain-containing protein [Polyangia bacterium]